MEDISVINTPEPRLSAKKKYFIYALGAVLLLTAFYYLAVSAPRGFPVGTTIEIEKGMSLGSVSRTLKENNLIRSRAAFEFFIIILGAERHIKPAFYFFEDKLPVYSVAWRMGGGRFYMAPTVVTIPEGFTREEIAESFSEKLPNFNKEQFLILSEGKEGFLFPDTYFFLNTDGEKEALEALAENFEKKIESLREEIKKSGHSEQEIITMASIIEGEAKGDLDRNLISGILWKRIKIGMPLQADAAPITYKEKGLPKEPIGNPGLKAIEAALRPETSPYLYYLHDKDGNTYYAKNFAEHRANIQKYLK